jgi:hypothetical protein
MATLTAEQSAYLERLLKLPPGDWPLSLQKTGTYACQEVQASYAVLRSIVAAWVLDGSDRVLSIAEIRALQPEVDLSPSMS